MEADVEERRRRLTVRRKLEGWKTKDIAATLGIHERTVYRWWRIYRKEGLRGLKPKSRRPHSYWTTPEETVGLILKLRLDRKWGVFRIERYLKKYAETHAVSHTTIYKILSKVGLNNPLTKRRIPNVNYVYEVA